MSIMKKRLLSAAIFSAALFLINGCILNPETEKPPPPEPIDWPDLTEMEDVIETITLCYENFNTATPNDLEEHYTKILYQEADNDYVFYLDPDDVDPGENPSLSLTEDVDGSMYIWEQSSFLTLDLSAGSWDPAEGIEGCDDCYTTTRIYEIVTTLDHNGETLDLSGIGFKVEFIVRPQYNDPTKWAIFIAYDRKIQ